MIRQRAFKVLFSFIAILLIYSTFFSNVFAAEANQKIYDYADLLTAGEEAELEQLANTYGEERQTDFIILTTNDTEGKNVVEFMQDFYDEKALGYDKPHGNTAILTVDMEHREIYLAGFYKAKTYLDDSRLDLIRDKITPALSNGDYVGAASTFIETSYEYMGIRPGVNPENILFKLWFQILLSLVIAGVVISVMVFNTGGKVTVNDRTYIDPNNSKVVNQRDTYIRTSVSKRKKPSNNSGGGGGSGGGITRGGHSHSGSRGSF
ncbi:TPM domain-containing protein [Bacillus sp. PS06]|uniref:TPM domain-containing protein n=1 Tax=Bacillus sp. PS06 TaxID=2764176 RepID=UPI001785B347|nr:TPM domain-containing protein [Bacillus sp. PS06]MBD8067896.1 TPM domain-containing protein [Bacillus sp. PS06]